MASLNETQPAPSSKADSPESASPKSASPRDSPPANVEAEVDDQVEFGSAYSDSDLESFTTSLSSSVLNYQYENGRRYHAFRQGQYFLPNDEAETDRLDLIHHTMLIALGGRLHVAPLDNPQRILDIGTGTGIWAIEMADLYPSAQIVGNDLSPIQPQWVPPNASFEIDDVESEWTYTPGSFDMIYCRYMLGSIKDWPRLFQQAFKALRPGGYIEILEPDSTLRCDDGTLSDDSALLEWNRLFVGAAEMAGRTLVGAPKYVGWLEDAGFTEIHEDKLCLPNSPWPKDRRLKELGGYHMAALTESLQGLSLRLFTTFHKMEVAQIEALLALVRKDIKNRGLHTYYNLHSIVARKPK